MWNQRHALIASRCSWCDCIWTGKAWMPERRSPGREIYANGICVACANLHFAGSQSRNQMNVERFRMRPEALDGATSA